MNKGFIRIARLSISLSLQDVGVTLVGDGHHGHTEELTAGSTQVAVVASVVVNLALGKESVVLDLRLAQSRGVVGDDDHLGLGGTKSLEGGLVAKGSLTRLHDKLNLAVDRLESLLGGLLVVLSRGHFDKKLGFV